LDAVLHPRALQDPKVLQQEGWHFELEDAKEPLTFKGVVYNEIKGKFYKMVFYHFVEKHLTTKH
jgi:Zn-dependent M16 (insulinase) family peptidase